MKSNILKIFNIILLLTFFAFLYCFINSLKNLKENNNNYYKCRIVDKTSLTVNGYEILKFRLFIENKNTVIDKDVDIWTYNKLKIDNIIDIKLSNSELNIKDKYSTYCWVLFLTLIVLLIFKHLIFS